MERQVSEKPPFRPLLKQDIDAVVPNGRTVISTFSGCGGSCLGFRMAGFRIGSASEFIESARETYHANYPDTPIDPRDIRTVKGTDLLTMAGLNVGDCDIFEGSPPCASFSTVGAGSRLWGQVKNYSETRQRTDDLFYEYARLVGEIQPKVFVAENVSGLVRGHAVGYFKDILRTLKGLGYIVRAQVLNAQWLGVAQSRSRTIFIGVRNDLGRSPSFPKPLPYRYSMREACPWIIDLRGVGRGKYTAGKVYDGNGPCPTVMAGGIGGGGNTSQIQVRTEAVDELSIAKYAIGREWNRLKVGQISDKYLSLVKPDPGKPCPTITATGSVAGAAAVVHPYEQRRFSIREVKRLSGFPDDFITVGTFQQQWERIGRAVPPVMMYWVARTILTEVFGDELPNGANF